MVLPELPVLLKQLKGEAHAWLIIPSFAAIALVSRPFSGKISDTAGRVFVMAIGAIVTMLSSVFYIFIPVVFLFFANRAFHGFCAGFTPTGFTAYADDIVSLEKRGEAMGIIGICNNIGNAIGWILGSSLSNRMGMDAMFVVAGLFGLASLLLFVSLKETIHNKQRFSLGMFRLKRGELFERRVFVPGMILLLTAFSSGAVLALIADYTQHLGIRNKGLFMSIYIFSSLIIRFMAGRWSDQYGRKPVTLIGAIFLVISMLTLALSQEIVLYTLSSVCFGIGFGLISPSVFAWAVDLSMPGYKGKAVGTLYIYMEFGIIIGSAACGLVYDNNPDNFMAAFMLSAAFALMSLLFYFRQDKYHPVPETGE